MEDDRLMIPAEGGGEEAIERRGRDAEKKHPLMLLALRGCCFVALLLAASSFFSFLFGILALLIGDASVPPIPVSIPARCRVVSRSVDLRSTRVCELGLSNYKAKHVLYPSGKTRVRCHDDYYWASIFGVEFKEYFSGRILRGAAESPKEALPLYCRPKFGTAWLTKSRFKVNETYECRYSLRTFKADIYPDHLFNCPSDDPSTAEVMRRSLILIMNIISSFSWRTIRSQRHILAAATGTISGILASMILAAIVKIILLVSLVLYGKRGEVKQYFMIFGVQFRRTCLLVAYISAVGWLTLQYSQFVGLKQLFFQSSTGTARTR